VNYKTFFKHHTYIFFLKNITIADIFNYPKGNFKATSEHSFSSFPILFTIYSLLNIDFLLKKEKYLFDRISEHLISLILPIHLSKQDILSDFLEGLSLPQHFQISCCNRGRILFKNGHDLFNFIFFVNIESNFRILLFKFCFY